ncbi:DUF4870 domain-containing protein [Brevibacillus sp. H7]|uniref:DUF4870 domain-containing protein n=1 Tax=Brevibacillus sp. H7 TaxID=3349138 RepID=UPI0038024ACF
MDHYVPGKEERLWATIAHLSAFCGFIFPLGNVLGPLIVWLIKREEGPFVDHQGKEALNFGISVALYAVISYILVFVLIGVLMLIALGIFWIVVLILAAVRTNDGRPYRYPLSIRFIK